MLHRKEHRGCWSPYRRPATHNFLPEGGVTRLVFTCIALAAAKVPSLALPWLSFPGSSWRTGQKETNLRRMEPLFRLQQFSPTGSDPFQSYRWGPRISNAKGNGHRQAMVTCHCFYFGSSTVLGSGFCFGISVTISSLLIVIFSLFSKHTWLCPRLIYSWLRDHSLQCLDNQMWCWGSN